MAINGGDGSIILTTNVDQTGLKKGLGSMGKTAKSFGAGVAKSFAVIGAAAATATVAITKMAVSAYADYEQLVGGVETLFKGSAQKVIDYANDAFYTAGVSANEYMQQVTSFSASLIRSTAGDTDKAADIANMALIDISDNVNKMGSSMESVTLAYQGFAKQQYMLLDNLKLGYGGTKTEMERLLKDAQALTGVKYDINNLADVYSAIHAIQEELGITGTTAKEAEKTITGSANMMKAAWQNVLSAIAGGGDLDRSINNLVYSIQKYFENIVPVVERSLVGIGRLIEQVAPMLVQNVASALIQSIPSLINAIYQMIIGLAKGIWQGIKALFTGGSGSVTADIKTSVGGIATEAGNASTGMESLGDATEKAGKQAKKSLAAFDDLNIISSGAGGGAGKTPEISTGGIGGANVPTAESTMDIKTEETGEQATWLSQRLGELAEAFSGIKNIDLTNLSNSLGMLKQPLQDLAQIGWDILLWGVENVIVPYTEFVVEEHLPRFFETLAIALRLFKTILDKGFKIFKQFYDEFLKPIAKYAADGFLKLWDDLNESLEEFVKLIENSTAWQDLQTILSPIYQALEPLVKFLIDFIVWDMKWKLNAGWALIRVLLLDIENALGLIAGMIEGDFDKQWGHLLGLLTKQKPEEAKKTWDEFWSAIDEAFQTGWRNITTWWQTSGLVLWMKDDVAPWFTSEKWLSLWDDVKQWWEDGWEEIFLWWEESAISTWFEEDGVIGKWFTWSAWETMWGDLLQWFKDGFSNIKTWLQEETFKKWFAKDGIIGKWFTWDAWEELFDGLFDAFEQGFKNAMNGAIDILNKGINKINELLTFSWDKIEIAGKTIVPAGSIDLGNLPNIPRLAQGAVIPPNREFLAVLGDQKHGTNIEAPLQTIVDAFNIALQGNANYGGGNTEVVLEIDGREFGRAVVEQGNRENRRIGTRLVIA